MRTALLTRASIDALITDGFIDRTYYRYIIYYYNNCGDIKAVRYALSLALFGGTPEIEHVRIKPRD